MFGGDVVANLQVLAPSTIVSEQLCDALERQLHKADVAPSNKVPKQRPSLLLEHKRSYSILIWNCISHTPLAEAATK